MKRVMPRSWRNRFPFLVAAVGVVVFFSLGFFVGSDNDLYLKIYRGIDTFGRVYKELTVNYVDEIDPEKFMRAGIDGMLKTLDPYTVYIGAQDRDEIDLVTNGKYGGVGITIGIRDGVVTVVNLLDGFSAAKQGIRVGDRILAVDGKNLTDISMNELRSIVRGAPGTEVHMKIERDGERAPLEFVLVREEISVKNVTYEGYVDKGIGYIRLERFSRTAGDDVRLAMKALQSKGELKSVILDLRDNPGGLLDMAVDVAAKFLPESSLVVTTKGRQRGSDRLYYTDETPMAPEAPLAILVNRGSASASEIVAGAIQDLDRGVIVGTRTFGKGLVQTITRLSENSSLKITTGRYYTPSGRSIQEIDYFNRTRDGGVRIIPDSLRRAFKTAHNREVFEGGGIKPDSTVPDDELSQFATELIRKAMFFKFATQYAGKHDALPPDFKATDQLVSEFERFVKDKGFKYQEEPELKLAELRSSAEESHYGKKFLDQLDHLSSIIKDEEAHAFGRHKDEIARLLTEELIERFHGESARIASTLGGDQQLAAAIALLKDKGEYHKLLAGTN